MIRNIFTSRNLSKHKRRFDRGGVYLSYLAILVTGGTFLKVFGITQWWAYGLGVLAVIVYRYVMGLLDEKWGILKNEQDQYTKQNPTIKEMADKVDKIYKTISHEKS